MGSQVNKAKEPPTGRPVRSVRWRLVTNNCLCPRRSRGIDAEFARQLLVLSFGAEVTQHLGHKQLQERMQAAVNAALLEASAL